GIDLAVIDWKSVAIASEQGARTIVIRSRSKRVAQSLGPTANDRFDAAIKRFTVGICQWIIGARDDVLNAHQRTLRKERAIAAQSALEGRGQILADGRSDLPAEAIARNVDQHRHIAVEQVAPRQHPHARPLVKMKDVKRKSIERILVDLKQVVPGISLEHIDYCFAGMAGRLEPGPAHDAVALAPQVRHCPGP